MWSRSQWREVRWQAGKTQTGKFGGALFVLAQSRNARLKGLTTLSLIEGVRGVPSYASCKARRADARAAIEQHKAPDFAETSHAGQRSPGRRSCRQASIR